MAEWEAFRNNAHQVIDWVIDYRKSLSSVPVISQVKSGDIRKALPLLPPQTPEPVEDIIKDLNEIIVPGLTNWQSPNFFAFFPCGGSPESLLGDIVSGGMGVQGMLWMTSPAVTELEVHVIDWMANLISLPSHFLSSGTGGGVIQGTASEALLVALVAARHRARKCGGSDGKGVSDEKMTIYYSDQAHSSALKAALIAGFSHSQLREIKTQQSNGGRFIAADLQTVLESDLQKGLSPIFCTATIGTTGVGAVDDIEGIGEICERERIWLHVDAAYAGSACICPEFQYLLKGVERADSFNFNPHKWMLVVFDLSILWIKDRQLLIDSLSVTPEYLRNAASSSGSVIDYRDWQIPLGRRFRSLKLWFLLRLKGLEAIQQHIRKGVELAVQFEQQLKNDTRFVQLYPRSLSLITFSLKEQPNPLTQRLMEQINEGGSVFLSHTISHGNYLIRMAIGAAETREDHIDRCWSRISQLTDSILSSSSS